MELSQIATAQFIIKCDGPLLQIATAFLLQSATRFITNCHRYYKVRWLLQIATVHVQALAQYLRALSGKKRTSMHIFRQKGDHYYIQTRHNDIFSHYNLFLGKFKEKLARKARVNTDASIQDRAYDQLLPQASHNAP